MKRIIIMMMVKDFPGGTVGKKPVQGTQILSLIPAHALGQLSPYTTTTEPALWTLGATTTEHTGYSYWSPSSYSLCSAIREKPMQEDPALQ